MNETKGIRNGIRRASLSRQRGGFAVGLVIGLLIGLALALGVALYVTKVPVPFLNKVPQRTANQDAAEAEKNKNWDPNSPLSGKNPAKPASAPDTTPTPTPTPPPVAVAPTTAIPSPRASDASSTRDPAAILAAKPASAPAPRFNLGAASASGGSDPFAYFVQAGAYSRTEDAEQQRAKLAMIGMEGKLTERDQSGHTVYRVRVGPFDRKNDADAAKDKLGQAGIEASLVRVQR
jgi:cell division protein FtsN